MVRARESVMQMQGYCPPLQGRKGVLRLDFNENTQGCSPKVIEALKKVCSDDLSIYPESQKFKSKLADFLGVGQSQVLITNGADEAIKIVMDAYVDKGDEVILPVPTFAMFSVYAGIAGAKVKEVLYNPDLSFPAQKVLDSISGSTRLVVIVNPNNPTGTKISYGDITRILEKARNSVVLLDEAYWQYSGASCKGLISSYDNLIVIQSFSKAFGLAGLRLGYIISDNMTIELLQKVISPYSINTLAMAAGSAALDDLGFVNDYVSQVREARKYVQDELSRLGIEFYPSEANFVLARFGDKCSEVCSELKAKGILVRSRTTDPLLNGCVRLGIGTLQECSLLVCELKKILRKRAILFDMDGVLVDVSNSYRLAIKKTAEFFTGQEITGGEIQLMKERGCYNNDWELTEALIRSKGVQVGEDEVVAKFQQLYLEGSEPLVNNERWLLSRDVLQKLYQNFRLGIVTGRPREEALSALRRFRASEFFDCVVAMGDYPKEKSKPDPAGINLALGIVDTRGALYIGDSVDDAKAAANAGIPCIGVIPPGISEGNLKSKLKENGSVAVLSDVNYILEVVK